MEHTMKLTSNPFERIAKGEKIIEVRLFDEKRKKINIGDSITFFELPNLQNSIKTEVIGLSRFKDFRTLFSVLGKDFFGHSSNITLDEQISQMREYYSEEDEINFGVLGIHIRLIS